MNASSPFQEIDPQQSVILSWAKDSIRPVEELSVPWR